jgi:hypothetical protein
MHQLMDQRDEDRPAENFAEYHQRENADCVSE